MCGRFTQMLPWRDLVSLYRLTEQQLTRNTEARFNVAPTQTVPFVRLDGEGNHIVDDGRWWLVPHWAKEVPKAAMFNARIETVGSSPAFRDAFKMRRCLVPADGFYEWTKSEDRGKDPWLIHMPDGAPYAFAGLWAHNTKLGVTSCTIITAPAIAPITHVHDRMPIILDPSVFDAWLNPATLTDNIQGILGHHIDSQMQMHRVSRDINSSRFSDRPAPIVNSL
jgi:putative SOS response-associated peptidase YedK